VWEAEQSAHRIGVRRAEEGKVEERSERKGEKGRKIRYLEVKYDVPSEDSPMEGGGGGEG